MTGEGETTYDIWNGRAHIVCNTHTRDGAMRDVDALRPALENRNFSVSTSAGALTGEAIRRAIAAASKEDYSQVGCLVLILSSHGGNNVIYGSDDSSVPLEWVSDQFRTSNCRSLDRKPRIILVQACRGNGNTPLADGRTNLAVADGRTNFTVDHCFFIAYATTPTHYAWRTTEGSPFLQAFVQQLGKEQSLSHMFHLVNCSVAKTFNSTTTAQCVQIVDTLPYSVEFSGVLSRLGLCTNAVGLTTLGICCGCGKPIFATHGYGTFRVQQVLYEFTNCSCGTACSNPFAAVSAHSSWSLLVTTTKGVKVSERGGSPMMVPLEKYSYCCATITVTRN